MLSVRPLRRRQRESGTKSVAFSLNYFDPERTLTDDEVVKAHEKVLAALTSEAGAQLRG